MTPQQNGKKFGMEAIDTANWPEPHLQWYEKRVMEGMKLNMSDVLSLISCIRRERERAAYAPNKEIAEAFKEQGYTPRKLLALTRNYVTAMRRMQGSQHDDVAPDGVVTKRITLIGRQDDQFLCETFRNICPELIISTITAMQKKRWGLSFRGKVLLAMLSLEIGLVYAIVHYFF